jgi:competence ComEA-like helix-hairpin-helix protein
MKILILILLMLSFVSAGCVDINTATLEELDEITWVGPATAQKIIDARPFDSVSELDKVSGIGEVKVSDILAENLACVSGEVERKDLEEEMLEEVDEEIEEIVRESEPKEIVLSSEPAKTISLGKVSDSEFVYQSKNSKIMNWLPYVFSIFLIVLVGILFWERF